MYRSLYQIIKPKIEAKESGVIELLHGSGQSGAILLEKGIITGIVQGEKAGIEAANIIFRWVNMAVLFMEGESMDLPPQKRLNTSSTLEQLKKIDARVAIFRELIGGCETIFKFVGQQIAGSQQFTPQELSLSFLLDGTKSLKEVLKTSDVSELDLLLTVCKLLKTGLLKIVRPHQPMTADKRADFLDQLEGILCDITGPVASVLINDAFQAVGITPEELADCDISYLFSVISFHLEEDEREAFSKWNEEFSL